MNNLPIAAKALLNQIMNVFPGFLPPSASFAALLPCMLLSISKFSQHMSLFMLSPDFSRPFHPFGCQPLQTHPLQPHPPPLNKRWKRERKPVSISSQNSQSLLYCYYIQLLYVLCWIAVTSVKEAFTHPHTFVMSTVNICIYTQEVYFQKNFITRKTMNMCKFNAAIYNIYRIITAFNLVYTQMEGYFKILAEVCHVNAYLSLFSTLYKKGFLESSIFQHIRSLFAVHFQQTRDPNKNA